MAAANMAIYRGCRVALKLRDGNDGRTGTVLGHTGGRWAVKMDDEDRVLTWVEGQLRRVDGAIPASPGIWATLTDAVVPQVPRPWAGARVNLVQPYDVGGGSRGWICRFDDAARAATFNSFPAAGYDVRHREISVALLEPSPLFPGGPAPDIAAPVVARVIDRTAAGGLPGFAPPDPAMIASFTSRVRDIVEAAAAPRWQARVIVTYADGEVRESVVADVELTTVLAALARVPGLDYRVEGAP